MTEYDYSPAAYEKYLETQNRIARWVDKTRRYAPSNPFVPATPAVECVPLRKDSNGSHRHQKSHSSRHPHRRTRSEDPLDKPRAHSASRSDRPRPKAPARWNTVSDHRSGTPTRESVSQVASAAVLPPPARRSRPLRLNTAPAHHYPAQDNHTSAAHARHNRADVDMSGHNRYPLVHSPPTKGTSTSKGSLLKRLLSVISKSGTGKAETKKGRRYSSVRR